MRRAVLALGILHLLWFVITRWGETVGISGLLYADGRPVGGDFINLWTTGRLILSGRIADIYNPEAFMAAEIAMTGAPIGLRLWAYPPHSLLLAGPFGMLGFYPTLFAWSLLGLVILWLGARRFGFSPLDCAVLLLSPATVLNVYYGQTGNLAAGLMLLALSSRSGAFPGEVDTGSPSGNAANQRPGALRRFKETVKSSGTDALPPIAAALLTIKPQAGFLLPLLWLIERRWRAIAIAGGLTIGFAALSVAMFGVPTWLSWLGETVPRLERLEKHGSGPFMTMIPSIFMGLRVVGIEGELAFLLHWAAAGLIAIFLVFRLVYVHDPRRRAALVLVGATLITPYIHNYDLGLLLAGALIVSRRPPPAPFSSATPATVLLIAWALPHLVEILGRAGIPLSPLLVLPLLLLA